jgi:hypothetical protein
MWGTLGTAKASNNTKNITAALPELCYLAHKMCQLADALSPTLLHTFPIALPQQGADGASA